MKSGSTLGLPLPALRAIGVAAALACSAAASVAADATVSITSFTVSADMYSGNYVWTLDPYQSFSMTALNAGGLNGAASDNFSADNWNLGLNRLAQTSNAKATGNTVQFTDASTQLTTAGFNLSATALPQGWAPGNLENYANASALQAGTFTLIDENGTPAAGTVTFDIYYDLNVAPPTGGYAQALVNLLSSSDAGDNASFADGLLTTTLGGAGATSGHFSWTFTLGAGEAAYYTLSGSAIAAAVPEPANWALSLMGLAAVTTLLRRRRRDNDA